jgi:hypothetical protein
MCGTKNSDILVPYIDSRVKIIDNERSGASPCGLGLLLVLFKKKIKKATSIPVEPVMTHLSR